MLKSICIFLIIITFIYLFGCQKDTSPIFATPAWLNEFIEDISKDPDYYRAVITRYEWKSNHYYDVYVPNRECIPSPCEVYDQSGQLIFWNTVLAVDYLNNRRNGFVIWSWKDNK